jgi:hypothetical protein
VNLIGMENESKHDKVAIKSQVQNYQQYIEHYRKYVDFREMNDYAEKD